MKIAVTCPSVYSVSPDLKYGGLERATFYLSKALSKEADITAFSPKGSSIPGCKVIETIDPPGKFVPDAERRAFDIYKESLMEFDVILACSHECLEYENREVALVKKLGGLQTALPVHRNFPCLVTESEFHRKDTRERFGYDSIPVPHCLDASEYTVGSGGGGPLIFGLALPKKGQLEAINALKAANVKFSVAGEVTLGDAGYGQQIKDAAGESYWGAPDEAEKRVMFRDADCIIIPSLTPEAFSIIAVEAWLSGTPVLWKKTGGAEAEMVAPGMGYIYEDDSRLPELIRKCGGIDRKIVRAVAEQRYDARVIGKRMMTLLSDAVEGNVW